jgi:hypothetical protein
MRRDGYVKPRAKIFAASQPFEPVMWSIGIALSGAMISLSLSRLAELGVQRSVHTA